MSLALWIPDNDDHTNSFPLHLCSVAASAFVSSFGISQNEDFDSSLPVCDFKDSVPYFLDKIYHLVLRMFFQFVTDSSLADPSLPESLRALVAAIKFLLHRLSLPESDMSHPTICQSLLNAVWWIRRQTFTSQEATAVMMVLDDILAHCVVPPFNLNPNWSRLCNNTILAYPSLTTVAPSACSLYGLQSMVDFIASQWDQTDKWRRRNAYQSDTACRALTDLLAKHIPVAFTVFLGNQCLQFLGNHTFHEASVPMVSAYVAGISAMRHGSDGAVNEATHIDYLHDPQNLFTVCSILATHGISNVDRNAIHRDITRLVQFHPQDAAWDECRRKLLDLVESNDGDYFSKQCVEVDLDEPRPLETNEIQVEKDNIGYAIHVLDDFFDSRAHATIVS